MNLKEDEYGWIKTRTVIGGFINTPGQKNGTIVFEKKIVKNLSDIYTPLHVKILEKYVDLDRMRHDLRNLAGIIDENTPESDIIFLSNNIRLVKGLGEEVVKRVSPNNALKEKIMSMAHKFI